MKRLTCVVFSAVFCLLAADARAITIPTVPVGNAGNAPDQLWPSDNPTNLRFGSVAYDYRIGTTEVTVGQYTAFLNSVATTDTYALYSGGMANLNIAGISRSGSSGSYTYSVIGSSANLPITYVSWGDGARFSNWLHNGQPTGAQGPGTTETGAYTLNGATSAEALNAVSRNSGATWFIPSESEWYKAAYYQPAAQGGDADNYWLYPTGTNSTPYSDQPPGSDAPTPSNTANFYAYDGIANGYNDGYAVSGSLGYSSPLSDAGAYALSASPYGTYDQGGNVIEWNETLIDGQFRGLRGGSWENAPLEYLSASHRSDNDPRNQDPSLGFRVATVPEPSTFALATLGVLALMIVRRRPRVASAAIVLSTLMLLAADARAVTIPTVPVGNAGNAADPLTGNLYGSVSYDYRIGTTEVTNAQYAEFLNFKAASDPLALFNTSMGSDARGGITRSGVSGSYTYTTKANMADKPVNYVSWYDAIRFANWLHNGQGFGDTETGAYTILGGTATPSNGLSITRIVGATWFLTSEDEWYKSAYYQPSAQGGDSDNYWLYPTGSNSAPTVATADSVGNISNPGANVANYVSGADWNSQNGNVTTVGSAGALSDSFYGTADQGGNVLEWNEALISGSFRGLRGGSWSSSEFGLQSSDADRHRLQTLESSAFGFRVATVPEPSTFVLAALGLLGVLACACRRRRRAGGV